MANGIRLTQEQRALFFAYDRALPLNAREREDSQLGLRVVSFVITSAHGERVPGYLCLPSQSEGPPPVVLFAHPATTSKDVEFVRRPALEWTAKGWATAAIDLPGHGERARPGEDLLGALRLPWQFRDRAVQTAVDLMRTLDYLGARGDVDGSWAGFVGFSLGALTGLPAAALDTRFRAICLCLAGAGVLGQAQQEVAEIVAPEQFAPLLAGRPVLMVNRRQDTVIPKESSERLYGALPGLKRHVWLEGGHFDISEDMIGHCRLFLGEHL